MAEIKRCPFCGEKPDDCIRGLSGYDCIDLHMVIVCRKCHIEKAIDVQGEVSFERLIEAHNKLIEDWNTRKGV